MISPAISSNIDSPLRHCQDGHCTQQNSAPDREIADSISGDLDVNAGLQLVGGQLRSRTLFEMLRLATSLAEKAGVTRLGELTHLDRLGFPVFQAIRPRSLSLSTSMGRGSTRRAAVVSALLEAIETDAAERLPGLYKAALSDLGANELEVWCNGTRDPLAVRLDPSIDRQWVKGVDLDTGQPRLVPLDLVSQNLTRPAKPDTLMSTVGLASGGTRDEALASALTELLEHDLESDWRRGTPLERRQCEINLSSVEHPAVEHAVRRVEQADCDIRLWSLGQDHGIAALLCFIADRAGSSAPLPPVAGAGCHPDRSIAALRAIQEAAQARCALISGARDDLSVKTYEDPRLKTVEALLASLCFGPGTLDWKAVPDVAQPDILQTLEAAHRTARERSHLPLIAVDLPSPHPALHIVKIAAPGLRVSERGDLTRRDEPRCAATTRSLRRERRVLFAGPSLGQIQIPSVIELKPPAVAGDLARMLADPPDAVALVDGCFETAPSVWHKELLDLMSAGVAVIGGASLGALRAAELHQDGMVGVGIIFECYRNQAVVRDDAVLLVHAPLELDYAPLSVSLIEAEAAILMRCRDAGERRILQRIARTMSFRDRTWPNVLAAFKVRTGRQCSVSEGELEQVPSIKQADVRQVLSALCIAKPSRPLRRPPLTVYYRRLLAQI